MEKIEIGKIVKPQGIKGDVKVLLFADDDFNLADYTEVYVEDNLAKIQKVYSLSDGCLGVKFDIINTRTNAETFRGKTIYINKSAINLKNGRYFMTDLIGKKAVLTDGTNLGKIVDIQNFGSADVLYIKGVKQILCSHIDGLIVNASKDNVVLDSEIFSRGAVYENWYTYVIPRNVCTT